MKGRSFCKIKSQKSYPAAHNRQERNFSNVPKQKSIFHETPRKRFQILLLIYIRDVFTSSNLNDKKKKKRCLYTSQYNLENGE